MGGRRFVFLYVVLTKPSSYLGKSCGILYLGTKGRNREMGIVPMYFDENVYIRKAKKKKEKSVQGCIYSKG